VVGSIGTMLGENNINLALMHMARTKMGGTALVILSVDDDVPPEVMDKLKKLPHVLTVQQVKL